MLASCKTTEANYRAAYEKTMAAKQENPDLDSTIYGTVRRQMNVRTIETAGGPVEIKTQLVRVTKDGGGVNENLKQYNVVAGQFKQIFNAKSFRNRLADNGYPAAFVVETAEPYYYIIAGSYADVNAAAKAIEELRKDSPIDLKDPCPFILDATARKGK